MEKIPVSQHLEELRESRSILKKLEQTTETDGCFCPFNKTYPHQAEVVHEVREILRTKIESEV